MNCPKCDTEMVGEMVKEPIFVMYVCPECNYMANCLMLKEE